METAWDLPGYPPFDKAAEMLDSKIANICAIVGATSPPVLYLTGKGNFRYEIAKREPYKSKRGNKPFHYRNLQEYIKAKYDTRVSEGMEADDLMAIEQSARTDTIICTRDKDLRAVPGNHYGWECGNQPSFGPEFVGGIGHIRLSSDRKSIKGVGYLFFLSQCLTGDSVDSIPGLPKCGPVAAFKTLEGTLDAKDGLKRVYGAYRAFYGPCGGAYRELLEQGRLLHMTRKLKEDGTPYLWGQTTK